MQSGCRETPKPEQPEVTRNKAMILPKRIKAILMRMIRMVRAMINQTKTLLKKMGLSQIEMLTKGKMVRMRPQRRRRVSMEGESQPWITILSHRILYLVNRLHKVA